MFTKNEIFKNLSLFLVSLVMLFLTLSLLADLFQVSGVSTQYFTFNRRDNHYHSNNLVYPGAYHQLFPRNKSAKTFRIFIFGGSCVFYLKDFALLNEMLSREYPRVHFEIINVGIKSYGSNRILPIVKEATRYQPDLFIYYEGHNEFLELFLKNLKEANFARMINERLLGFKEFVFVYRGITHVLRKFDVGISALSDARVRISWARPLAKIERQKIYLQYELNVGEMVRVARDNHIGMIISTVAYNYIDDRYVSPLYFSGKHENTRHDSKQIMIDNITDAEIFELARWEKEDPYIENRLGKSYLKEKNYGVAREFFIDASKNDFQPFRANAITNGIIRRISRNMNVPLADVEELFVRRSPYLIPDFNLFRDWCHPNNEGNRLVQEGFFYKIRDVMNSSAIAN